MGDYLDCRVDNVTVEPYKRITRMTLCQLRKGKRIQPNISFELPLEVRVKPGDLIAFFQGTVRNSREITHDDYRDATIFRSSLLLRKEKELAHFYADDMRVLSEMHAYARTAR